MRSSDFKRRRANPARVGGATSLIENLERRTLLSVGTLPSAVHYFGGPSGPDAADPVRNLAYVVDQSTHRVIAINTDTGTTANVCAIAADAGGMAVSLDDTRLYVAEPSTARIQVFSLPALSPLPTLNVSAGVSQIIAGANGRIYGSTSGTNIMVCDGATGATLYTLPNNGELRTNPNGTILYSRPSGLLVYDSLSNDGSLYNWDISGTGAPASLPTISGPAGYLSKDFAVDNTLGKVFFVDGGSYGFIVTKFSDEIPATWQFISDKASAGVAEQPGSSFVYGMSYNDIEQFDQSGFALNACTLPQGDNLQSLVITPNGNLIYTFPNGVGIVGVSSLNVFETTHLLFTAQPTNAELNSTIAPALTVEIDNAEGNLQSTDSSDVTLALSSGTVNGTVTVAAVNGVATFSDLSVSAAGGYTLHATDGSLAAADSSMFFIFQPSLKFLPQPPNGSMNATLTSFSVEVLDSFGKVFTPDDSTVSLSVASGPGNLTGTASAVVQNGIAKFTNVALDAGGSYTLKASDGIDKPATSLPFTITVPIKTPNRLAFIQQPGSNTAGAVISPAVQVEILDSTAHLVTTDNSTVTLSLASGLGTLGGTLSVAASNGIATFSDLVLSTAGSHQLLAIDGTDTTATSATFTTTAAPLNKHLVFAQKPTGGSVGAILSPAVAVAVRDSNNQLVTSDNSTVTLSLAGGSGTLGGTLTAVVQNGVATFSNLTLSASGAHTLLAVDGADTSVQSNSFTTTPVVSASNHLAFNQQPTGGTAGAVIFPAVTVEILDANNQLVTADNSTVTLALASGPGVLGGTLSVAAQGGIATFSNLVASAAGSHTLLASDGADTAAQSSVFATTAVVVANNRLVFVQQPTGGVAGSLISPAVTVEVLNSNNQVVTSDSSFVTLSLASGLGTLGGTLTAPVQNGIATFGNLALATAGTYTLFATDGADTSATSAAFTITAPAVAPHLAFVQQPTAATTGATLSPSITVEILNSSNQLIATDNSSITLSLASGPGTMGGTTTVSAQNGIATFSNLALSAAGVHTLLAADGSDTSATSASFTTTAPAVAPHLAFVQQPTNAIAGAIVAPAVTVEILDATNQIITADNSSVTLSLAGGAGSLGGTLTVAAKNGVATFSDLTLAATGSHSLAASDGGDTSVVSSVFTITAATTNSTHLVFVQQPSDAVAGAAISPIITVEIADQNNAVITTGTSTVTLQVASGPSTDLSATVDGTLTATTSNGIATFSGVFLNTSGSYTLVAASGNDGPAISGAFVVNPAAAAKLLFIQQPSAVLTGQTMNPPVAVQVEDQFSNIVTNYAGNIALSIAAGTQGAMLQGGSAVATQSGVATFAALAVDEAGSYSITATSASLAAITSDTFSVTSPVVGSAPSSLLTATPGALALPQSVIAGAAVKGKLLVAISDPAGAYGGPLTVSLYADTDTSLGEGKVLIASITQRKFTLKANRSKSLTLKLKSLPAITPDGTYNLFVQLTDSSGASATQIPRTVDVAAPFVQPAAAISSVSPASIVAGKSGSILVTLTNNGNESAHGIDLTLGASTDGTNPIAGLTLAHIKSGGQLKAQQKKTYRIHFKASQLPPGNYYPCVSVSLGGVSTIVVAATAFTVA